LIRIVHENPATTSTSDPGAVKERQFAIDYLDESSKAQNGTKTEEADY
jgi:hypothetical protein